MFRSRFFLIIMALTISAGQMFGQKIHPDISSKTAKAVVDPSVIKGPIKPMNAVNNGPNVADYADQMEDFRILNIPFCRTTILQSMVIMAIIWWIFRRFSLILLRTRTRNHPIISAKQISLSKICWIPEPR